MKTFRFALLVIAALAFISCSSSKDTSKDENKSSLITTASGLQYEDIVVGKGAKPEQGKEVSVHYTGRLEDGSVFDSSVEKNKPFNFKIGVGQVIKGWDEGVMGMQVGGKRKLIIPPALGYGERAAGKIPPNSVLIFDVELLEVK